MSNKKYKKSFTDFAEDVENFSFDDIPFAEIGDRIKNSINGAIRGFSSSSKKKLPQTRNPKVCEQDPPGRTASILARIGAILSGMVFFAITIASYTEFHWAGGFAMIFATIISGLLTLASPYILWKIADKYKRLSNNYVRFLRELGDNTVISVRDLASGVAQSEEQTRKEILYMMKKNYFKQARIVEDGKIFILDIPTFKLYKERLDKIDSSKESLSYTKDRSLSAEDLNKERADEIIKEAQKSLDEIFALNKKIDNPSFKRNVDRLMAKSIDILKIIEKYPDKATNLGKFSSYYLPTSLKLVESYKDFELANSTDDRILKSMTDIEGSVKTIAEAFENIKNDLLDDRAMDVKTEIDTINLLLKQEGLANDDWR